MVLPYPPPRRRLDTPLVPFGTPFGPGPQAVAFIPLDPLRYPLVPRAPQTLGRPDPVPDPSCKRRAETVVRLQDKAAHTDGQTSALWHPHRHLPITPEKTDRRRGRETIRTNRQTDPMTSSRHRAIPDIIRDHQRDSQTHRPLDLVHTDRRKKIEIRYCQDPLCRKHTPRKCEQCEEQRNVSEFGPADRFSRNLRARCLSCEFPTCKLCGEKYPGKRAAQRNNPGFVGQGWYCAKPGCRKVSESIGNVPRRTSR